MTTGPATAQSPIGKGTSCRVSKTTQQPHSPVLKRSHTVFQPILHQSSTRLRELKWPR